MLSAHVAVSTKQHYKDERHTRLRQMPEVQVLYLPRAKYTPQMARGRCVTVIVGRP